MKRFLVAWLVSVALGTTVHAATVDLYGRPHTFGTLGDPSDCGSVLTHLPFSQISLSVNSVCNWQLDPGQTFFFPAVTSDGTLFFGNITQTFNQFFPTSCSMGVTCFNPDDDVCPNQDPETGRDRFGTIRIPTGGGATYVPAGGCAELQGTCGTDHKCTNTSIETECSKHLDCEIRSTGADVGDVEVISDTSSGESVLFNSGLGSISSASPDAFPALGALRKDMDGVWTLAPLSTRTPLQLSESNPLLGPLACPGGKCNLLGEIARLPVSGRIAMLHYFGGITVMDGEGTILAHYSIPELPDPCDTDPPYENMIFAPREVDVDPTSSPGNERFVVVYDMYSAAQAPLSQPTQEFRYDEGTHTLAPVSAPIFPYTASHPAVPISGPSCGEPRQVTVAQYDHGGNLWFARSDGTDGGPILIILKDPVTGKRKMETDCGVLDASGQPRPWGFHCLADLETGVASVSTSGVLSWALKPWTANLVEDEESGTMFAVQFNGLVAMVDRNPTDDGSAFTFRPRMILGVGALKPRTGVCSNSDTDGNGTHDGTVCNASNSGYCTSQGGKCLLEERSPTKGVIDAARRALWIPIKTTEPIDDPLPCDFYLCRFEVGETRDAWLYRIQIDEANAFGPRVSSIQSPARVITGSSFDVAITANVAPPLNTNSFLAVYVNGAASRVVPDAAWSSSCPSGGECTFTATVPASITSGVTGSVVWHGLLGAAPGLGLSLHSVGRVAIDLDSDADGIGDPVDNCKVAPNASQTDTNADGFGNRCDADYDDNGMVGISDYGMLLGAFGTTTGMPGFDPEFDLNDNGVIGGGEVAFFLNRFGLPPGPSGLACAGTSTPCPAP